MTTKKVGVLALQGSVIEHIRLLKKVPNVEAIEVRTPDDLDKIDGLILPGGESTTIGKLLCIFGLKEPIINRVKSGMPIWGTCAGMILLAKELSEDTTVHLGLMDIKVKRNAYGSQLDSFSTNISAPKVSDKEFVSTFIRAPLIECTWNDCEAIAIHDEKIVAAKQNNMLVTSFHPELHESPLVHRYFCDMIV